MEKPIISKCGYRCDLCLAYPKNVQRKDERKKLSDGWYEIYGFRIEAEDIVCDGCVSGENPRLVDKNCPVRPCAVEKKLKTCATCGEYICEKLKQRIVNKKDLKEKLGRKFTADEYENFVKPYESEERLNELRKLEGQFQKRK